jgi:ABC-type multidrug transport system fused ATPase/permease subunit
MVCITRIRLSCLHATRSFDHKRQLNSICFMLAGALFRKSTRVRDLCGYSVGELVNICTNDSQRMFEVIVFAGFSLTAAISWLASLVLCWWVIGPSAILGISVFMMMFPIQVIR